MNRDWTQLDWALPADERLLPLVQLTEGLISLIDSAPRSPNTLDAARSQVAPTTYSPNRN